MLGSGWLPAVDALGEATAEIDTTDLPGFSAAAVAGHSGKIRSVRAGDKQLLVFLSRTHYYEGKGVEAVVHGVRTAARAGCRAIVLTNGCGGLKESWTPGTPVLISDHINLTGRRPIVGANFVDLTDLYSSRLRAMCREVDPSLDEGVYVQFPGPHYETPAEVRMAGILGGQLVGMSTTLEAIAAREAGMEVLGISLVTNLAAGISDQPLNHAEVLEAGRAAASRMGDLLGRIVPGSEVTAADETRQRLVEAATAVFAEDGVFTGSLVEITRRAGQRNRGAVHYHFGSREGVLVAVLERHVDVPRRARGRAARARPGRPPTTTSARSSRRSSARRPSWPRAGCRGRCFLVIVGQLVEESDRLDDDRRRGAQPPPAGTTSTRCSRSGCRRLRRGAQQRAVRADHRLHPALGRRPGPGRSSARHRRAAPSCRPSAFVRNLVAMARRAWRPRRPVDD